MAQLFWNIYERNELNDRLLQRLQQAVRDAFAARKKSLRDLDLQRFAHPDWHLSAEMVGSTLYVDLFSDTFRGLQDKIDYFKQLGITYIHLLPVFKTRPGQDDGGYAVSDFRDVHEKLGTLADLEALLETLHANGISLCLDFIMNHTAKEHEWAQRARAGEREYQDMYFMFDSYEIPAQFEQHLPQIFPDTAPGNFTYYEDIKKWVFTTFYEFQWDLNYKNPLTLIRIIEDILFLANVGVDVFRIDAIRHIWKEIGTDCSSLPQTYDITDLLKTCVYAACPGVLFLGEATTTLDQVIKYMGKDDKGCQLMYNVSFMGGVWNALATENVRYLQESISGSPTLPDGTCWKNYLRCHDDLGFVIDEKYATLTGLNAPFQESQLISFYKGDVPGSFSRGELYCFDPKTRYSRISGTLASFCGLEKALASDASDRLQAVDRAIERILLLYSMLLSYEGLPLLYAGDEIGQLNDYGYKNDPDKAPDTRWLHRFPYKWDEWSLRDNGTSVQGQIFQGLQHMIATRKREPLFAANLRSQPFATGSDAVYAALKQATPGGHSLLVLGNFAARHQVLNMSEIGAAVRSRGVTASAFRDLLSTVKVDLSQVDGKLTLRPYQYFWFSSDASF
jgi:amylosucrase